MTKYFCDVCKNEGVIPCLITKIKVINIRVKIKIYKDDIWINGDICHKCLIKMINEHAKESE